MSRQKNDPVRELGVMYEKATLSWYLLRLFVLLAAVGALVIGFVIHYRSASTGTPAPSKVPSTTPTVVQDASQWIGANILFVLAIVAGILAVIWIGKKALQQSHRTQAEEDRKRLRAKELESYFPPGERSIPDRRRKAQIQTLWYGLCIIGALIAIHFLFVPLLSYGVQEWERNFISRTSRLPLAFYGIIMLLTISLLPMTISGRRLLYSVAALVAFVALGTEFLLFGAKIPQSETASLLAEIWGFLWQPVLVPHGWLFLFGAPILIMVTRYFLATWEERTMQNVLTFYFILALNTGARLYFINSSV